FALEVMGAFAIDAEARITRWRYSYDLKSITDQIGAAAFEDQKRSNWFVPDTCGQLASPSWAGRQSSEPTTRPLIACGMHYGRRSRTAPTRMRKRIWRAGPSNTAQALRCRTGVGSR